MKIRHIFFDLDHTLWDFETNSNRTFEFIFNKNDIDVNLNDFIEIYSPINHKYWKLFREEKVTKAELRYQRLKEAFNELNFYTDDNLIDHLAEEYIENLAEYNALFSGAIELLEYLQPKYKMHIITNGFEEVQYRKLRNSNLIAYFDQIITSERVGVKKPNPKIFEHALSVSGGNAEESIMIGDNLEADILGAISVNMHAILCDFNDEIQSNGILKVNDLLQIKKYL